MVTNSERTSISFVAYYKQWNLDLTNGQGTGFVISRVFSLYFTNTGAENMIRYIEDFVS